MDVLTGYLSQSMSQSGMGKTVDGTRCRRYFPADSNYSSRAANRSQLPRHRNGKLDLIASRHINTVFHTY